MNQHQVKHRGRTCLINITKKRGRGRHYTLKYILHFLLHLLNVSDVPGRNVTCKLFSVHEHVRHVFPHRCVPGRNVFVEGSGWAPVESKEGTKVGDAWNIPSIDRTVLLTSVPGSTSCLRFGGWGRQWGGGGDHEEEMKERMLTKAYNSRMHKY